MTTDDTRRLADLLADTEGGGWTEQAGRLIEAGIVLPERHAALVAAARVILAAYDDSMHSLADEADYRRRDTMADRLRALVAVAGEVGSHSPEVGSHIGRWAGLASEGGREGLQASKDGVSSCVVHGYDPAPTDPTGVPGCVVVLDVPVGAVGEGKAVGSGKSSGLSDPAPGGTGAPIGPPAEGDPALGAAPLRFHMLSVTHIGEDVKSLIESLLVECECGSFHADDFVTGLYRNGLALAALDGEPR